MKAIILEVEGPNERNTFDVSFEIEENGKKFNDTIKVVSLQNVESGVKEYMKEVVQMAKLQGKVIELGE
jgi:hypothetical protein